MSFICIHELGHIIPALFFEWTIDKIILLPFGGLTVFQEKINRPLKEEFVIAIGGVFVQTLFYIVVTRFFYDPMVAKIHYGILLFNLIPIFPLDGSKIVNICFNLFFPFIKSHTLSIFLSYICFLFLLFFMRGNLILYLSLFFLNLRVLQEVRNHLYLFQQFLWERYIYTFPFKHKKLICSVREMKRDTIHIFAKQNRYINEKDFLANWFDKKT